MKRWLIIASPARFRYRSSPEWRHRSTCYDYELNSVTVGVIVFTNYYVMSCSSDLPLKLHLTTSEQWFGQEQEGILPELLSSSSIV